MDLKNKSKSLALWFGMQLKTTKAYATLSYQDPQPKQKIGMLGILQIGAVSGMLLNSY
jgi:hypothetical protein